MINNGAMPNTTSISRSANGTNGNFIITLPSVSTNDVLSSYAAIAYSNTGLRNRAGSVPPDGKPTRRAIEIRASSEVS